MDTFWRLLTQKGSPFLQGNESLLFSKKYFKLTNPSSIRGHLHSKGKSGIGVALKLVMYISQNLPLAQQKSSEQ